MMGVGEPVREGGGALTSVLLNGDGAGTAGCTRSSASGGDTKRTLYSLLPLGLKTSLKTKFRYLQES